MTAVVSVFRVEELDSATEENELREVLTPMPGVLGLEFDLVARQVRVRHELDTPDSIAAAIRSVGMRPKLLIATPTATNSRSLSNRTIGTTVVAGLLAISSEALVIAGAKNNPFP